jgi:hypothetical protein
MAIGRGIVHPLLLIALMGVSPLSAQRAESRGDQSPALIAGRDAIVTYGLTPEQVQELTKAAAAGAVGPFADKIVDLSKQLGVTQGAALTLLRILDQRDVPLDQLPQKLAEVATQYQQAQAHLAALNPQNPLARSRRSGPSGDHGWQLQQGSSASWSGEAGADCGCTAGTGTSSAGPARRG